MSKKNMFMKETVNELKNELTIIDGQIKKSSKISHVHEINETYNQGNLDSYECFYELPFHIITDGSCVYDDKGSIYFFGGSVYESEKIGGYSNKIYKIDLYNCNIEKVGELPTNMQYNKAMKYENDVYIFGAWEKQGEKTFVRTFNKIVKFNLTNHETAVLDIDLSNYTTNNNSYYGGNLIFNNKIIFFSGYDNTANYQKAYLFDPATSEISLLLDNIPAYMHINAWLNGNVLTIYGGAKYSTTNEKLEWITNDTIYNYNLENGNFTDSICFHTFELQRPSYLKSNGIIREFSSKFINDIHFATANVTVVDYNYIPIAYGAQCVINNDVYFIGGLISSFGFIAITTDKCFIYRYHDIWGKLARIKGELPLLNSSSNKWTYLFPIINDKTLYLTNSNLELYTTTITDFFITWKLEDTRARLNVTSWNFAAYDFISDDTLYFIGLAPFTSSSSISMYNISSNTLTEIISSFNKIGFTSESKDFLTYYSYMSLKMYKEKFFIRCGGYSITTTPVTWDKPNQYIHIHTLDARKDPFWRITTNYILGSNPPMIIMNDYLYILTGKSQTGTQYNLLYMVDLKCLVEGQVDLGTLKYSLDLNSYGNLNGNSILVSYKGNLFTIYGGNLIEIEGITLTVKIHKPQSIPPQYHNKPICTAFVDELNDKLYIVYTTKEILEIYLPLLDAELIFLKKEQYITTDGAVYTRNGKLNNENEKTLIKETGIYYLKNYTYYDIE